MSPTPIKNPYRSEMNLTTNVTKVAVAQMTSSSNISRNVSQIRNMTLFAAKNKAQMIFFPENAHFMGTSRDASLSIAQSLHGTAIECYRDMAKTNNVRKQIKSCLHLLFSLGFHLVRHLIPLIFHVDMDIHWRISRKMSRK